MPITSIRLRNFRCFEDSGEIPIKPLTVIFGRNNAGKSSILQSLLLLRQTLDRPEFGERLNMRGPLYPAGSFSDIVHLHQSRQNVGMEFDVKPSYSRSEAKLTLEFSSDEPQPPRLARLRVESSDVPTVEIRRGRGRGGPYELNIDSATLGGGKAANFILAVNQFLPVIGDELPRQGRPNNRRNNARRLARVVLKDFEQTLNGIRAVGPFRSAPDRRYDYQGTPPNAVDLEGENVVHAVIEDSTRRAKHRGSLLKLLNRWLARVGRVKLLPLRRLSSTARLYELRLKDISSGRWANFADVGFGIGQALPVLVEGLRTPPGGIFIVQEPEIHLHPDAQLAMADFLIELSRAGRTVIVETHSEALLLRVRKATVERQGKRRSRKALHPDSVSIVHVASVGEGASRAHALGIDELGQISEWPSDFMEEVTRERLDLLDKMATQAAKGR